MSLNNKKIQISHIKDSIRVMRFFSRIAWKTKKSFFFYYITNIIINSIGPFFSVIGTRYLVDEIAYLDKRNIYNIIIYTTVIILGDFLYRTLSKVSEDKQNLCIDKIDRQIIMMTDDISMKVRFQDTENPEVLNQMKKATKGYSEIGYRGITKTIATVMSNLVIVAGVVYLVVKCSFVLLVVVIVNFIIASGLNERVAMINYEYFPKVVDRERGFDYICNKLPSYQFGKEIRLYNAEEMIIEHEQKLAEDMVGNQKNKFKDVWRVRKWFQVSDNVLTGIVYTILALEIIFEKITIGEFCSLISAVNKFTWSLKGIINNIFELQKNTKILDETIKYFNIVEYDSEGIVPDKDCNIAIEFRNVSFKYPKSKEYTLKNVNVKIKAGEHVAIVGENGTGKTTFIKLICRLYRVSEGEILLNGKNINEYKFEEYIKLLSVVFQDFKLLSFTFKENITLEDNNNDDDKIMQFCEIGGISERILKSEKKLNTSIYKMFETDGIEPSGGEAQKLAIVRALYKNAPLVILDEPTAALDPISEYEIYKNFNSLVGDKTAIYISHRLSSCRFCDRIIVFSDKTIKEEGSHEELVSMGKGIYSKMYSMQAQYYQ